MQQRQFGAYWVTVRVCLCDLCRRRCGHSGSRLPFDRSTCAGVSLLLHLHTARHWAGCTVSSCATGRARRTWVHRRGMPSLRKVTWPCFMRRCRRLSSLCVSRVDPYTSWPRGHLGTPCECRQTIMQTCSTEQHHVGHSRHSYCATGTCPTPPSTAGLMHVSTW